MIRDAVFSENQVHRWRLSRSWAPDRGTVCWIAANPSVAGKDYDDPSCTRMIHFTDSFGYGRLILVNVSPYVTTDPKDLPVDRPELLIPKETADWIIGAVDESKIVIAAWGVLKGVMRAWADSVADVLKRHDTQLFCLGTTKDGSPRHPLYVPYSRKLVRWR